MTSYTVGPAVLDVSVSVTATASAAGASIRVNGAPVLSGLPSAPLPLAIGDTLVTVVVTAPDGVTTRTVLVEFDRTSAQLNDLTTSVGALAPSFDPTHSAYSVDVDVATGSATLTASAADPGATITVNAVLTGQGAPSAPTSLSLGLTPVLVVVTARDGSTQSYTVVFNRRFLGQQAHLDGSIPPSGGGAFGVSVAMSGDTLVVGADATATVGGNQVYVYVRSGGVWSLQASFTGSNTEFGDYFGNSVAISGDTLVVGDFGESSAATGVFGNQADNSATAAGAAYVFVRHGTTWSQQAYLKASNTDAHDQFGHSVAISGDTIVVGAVGEASAATGVDGNQADNSAATAGAAYVFVRDGGNLWSQQAYLKASNTGSVDGFGWSVAISGDTVAVGANAEDSPATGVNGAQGDNNGTQNSGAVYVFVRSGVTWSQQAYIKASNTGAGDHFGYSVAIEGDTLAVGAYNESSGATGVNGNQADNSVPAAGAAYVFVRSGTTWSQQAYLKASSPDVLDVFGVSIALSGDALVVGASWEDSAATGVNGDPTDDSVSGSGAAYLYVRTGTTWAPQAYLKGSTTGTMFHFGCGVAMSGGTLAIGANLEGSGAVYVFR